MSRKSQRDQRLHLYELGNDRCPICLTSFDKTAVEYGKEVTLEHVPPKGLSNNSIAMCLTCAKCNNTAGKGADFAAISLARVKNRSIDVRVDFPDCKPLTGKWTPGGGLLILGRPGVEPGITANTNFQISFSLPTSRFASVSHLKSAYLSVFSLLGTHGYRYAESKALRQVCEQIMNPHDEIKKHYALKIGDLDLDGIAVLMNRDHQYWAVKIEDCIIILPKGGNDSFYEEAEVFKNNGRGTISGPIWYPVKFDRAPNAELTREKVRQLKESMEVDNLFGQEGKIFLNNGNEWPVVVAFHHESVASILKLPDARHN